MKKLNFVFVALTLLSASCSTEVLDQVTTTPVTVRVNDFTMTVEDSSGSQTRSTSIAGYEGVAAVTLAFYEGSTEIYKTTQLRSDASTYTTFGEFSLSLPKGSYTMVILAYNIFDDEAFTLTSPTLAAFTTGGPRETFAATQTVNITSTTAVSLSATLSRIIAQLFVVSDDKRTADVSQVRMTFSAGGKAFNPTTGLATTNTGFSNTVPIRSNVGARSGSIAYLYLATDEQTLDVTIETLDSEGHTISTKLVRDVPFKRNRITKLTGPLYTAPAATTFQLDTSWLTDHTMTF